MPNPLKERMALIDFTPMGSTSSTSLVYSSIKQVTSVAFVMGTLAGSLPFAAKWSFGSRGDAGVEVRALAPLALPTDAFRRRAALEMDRAGNGFPARLAGDLR